MAAAERILAICRDISYLTDRLNEIIRTTDNLTYNLCNLYDNLFDIYAELGYSVCDKCEGKGYITYTTEDDIKMKQLCPDCNGTGIEVDFSKNLENLIKEK